MWRVFAILVLFLCTSAASAQIIYEPIQYEHRVGNDLYYYGGADPYVMTAAERQIACDEYGHVGRRLFSGGAVAFGGERFNSEPWIFDDCRPYANGALFGLTVNDVRNRAYEQAPRYFRKSEALANARVLPDGTRIVPATPVAREISLVPPAAPQAPTTQPARPKGFILIIPTRKADPDRPVALAE